MMTKDIEVFIDPFTDFGFKRLFGEERNKPLLIDFLNAFLKMDRRIVDLIYLNNEQPGLFPGDRKSAFDVYCKEEDGNMFIIEMQRLKEKHFKDRSVYYSTFPIRSQAKPGNWNFELKQTFTICLMEFCFDDTHPSQMIHEVKLIDTQTKEVFCDRIIYWYIEMPKFKKKEDQLITREDQWFFILNSLKYLKEIPLSLKNDPVFKQFFMEAEEARLMEAELEAYYASKKEQWDKFSELETAMEEGIEQGLLEAKLLVARQMKMDNEPLEKIIKYTGLSLSQVEKL